MIARIICDRESYALPSGQHTGSNLRAFFGVPSHKDLYVEARAAGDDTLIEDSDAPIAVWDRDKFFTVDRKILGS